ncbi:hypothetical protein ACSQ67_017630 [Phaseolus vulgaris]
MSFFSCCKSSEKINKNSFRRSSKDFNYEKAMPSCGRLCFKPDNSKRKYIEQEIAKIGKGNITSQTFSYYELCIATRHFNSDNMIGEGGFGRVYKGRIKSIHQVVAVKKLNRNGFQGNREFLVEVLILSLLHHPNLVNLVGYCADGEQRILVYEYMVNGSLEDHLLGKELLLNYTMSCNEIHYEYKMIATSTLSIKLQWMQ